MQFECDVTDGDRVWVERFDKPEFDNLPSCKHWAEWGIKVFNATLRVGEKGRWLLNVRESGKAVGACG